MIDQQVALILQEKITDAFQTFAMKMLEKFHFNPRLASLPVVVSYFIAHLHSSTEI